MKHICHWPGCAVEVPPRLWGCKPHWFKLPKPIRDRIWQTYRPGQEIDKQPSPEYLEIAAEARRFAENHASTTGEFDAALRRARRCDRYGGADPAPPFQTSGASHE